mgnify:FL=1
MMLRTIRNTLAVAGASLAIAVPTQAAIVFDAQFVETFFDFGDGDETTDSALDQFIFGLTQDGPGTFDVTIDAVFVTFGPSADPAEPIVVDLDDPNIPDPTPIGLSVGVDLWGEVSPAPGDDFDFGLGFFGFGIGDGFTYNIDIDDEDAVVNGTEAATGSSTFAGSSIEVLYTDNGIPNEERLFFNFGACLEPASPSDCSLATGEIPATDLTPPGSVPAPMSVALMGLGLLGLAGARRRR